MKKVYRIACGHIEETDTEGNDVAFTSEALARKWALKQLEANGCLTIYEVLIDPDLKTAVAE